MSPSESVAISPQQPILTSPSTITFTCTAQGGPNNEFVWSKLGPGQDITNSSVFTITDGGSVLTINNIAGNFGTYTCTC